MQRTASDLSARIVAGSPDAILYADRSGLIRLWNAAAERMFGYSPAEALGQSLDLIIPAGLRERHWDGWRRVLETGTSGYDSALLSVPAQHKSGRRISCEFSIVMIKDEVGRLNGFASIMRDVTSRWEREKELKARLAALEEQRNQL
jgi:PAS domain S-box-containing protein